jgi:hypothetical protein
MTLNYEEYPILGAVVEHAVRSHMAMLEGTVSCIKVVL